MSKTERLAEATGEAAPCASPFWWLPYAVGGFMLTPFAVWAGLYLSGIAGPKSGFGTPEMVVLLFASLPLAAFFFLANLGQMASAMRSGPGGERVPRAARLMPWLSLSVGAGGIALLTLLGRESEGILAVGVTTAAMVALMAASLRSGPATARPSPQETPQAAEEERALWLLVTPLLGVAFLALAWSPAVIFYAALIGIPLAFVAILAGAHAGLGGGSP
ncbi:hypothetical protein KO353_06840 [Elioraea tepida]|uniref:Uncharacterized protein n=1 Tax=Elioraea tepida TaxID=2843330 RepID=A0A975U437_9PROT|nr:hypothetical protein [Elioraea tepida]QXM25904.1 hypothetical protein KO353_06840 [Elioraea tepida]